MNQRSHHLILAAATLWLVASGDAWGQVSDQSQLIRPSSRRRHAVQTSQPVEVKRIATRTDWSPRQLAVETGSVVSPTTTSAPNGTNHGRSITRLSELLIDVSVPPQGQPAKIDAWAPKEGLVSPAPTQTMPNAVAAARTVVNDGRVLPRDEGSLPLQSRLAAASSVPATVSLHELHDEAPQTAAVENSMEPEIVSEAEPLTRSCSCGAVARCECLNSARVTRRLAKKCRYQHSHWGFPSYFCEAPHGSSLGHYLEAQKYNGAVSQMKLYHYDFAAVDGPEASQLTPRGNYQVLKIAQLLEQYPGPVVVQRAVGRPELDEQRRQSVLAAIGNLGVDVQPDQVVAEIDLKPGLSAVEELLIHQNLLEQTTLQGMSKKTGNFSSQIR